MALGFDIEVDVKQLLRLGYTLERMGNIPQKCVTAAAGKGATVAGRAVKKAAPRGATKQLSKGFKRYSEKRRVRGKKVYHYAMDPGKNDIFQKPIKNPGVAGGRSGHGYYPASVEYGFLKRDGGFHPGTHFARDAAEAARPEVNKVVMETLVTKMEKEWQKK